MPFRLARNTLFSTTLLSIASLGGSLGSCAMQEKKESPQYRMAEERPRYCYNTLGEVSCFSDPQQNMGPVVALEAERIIPHDDAEAAVKDELPANTASPSAAPAYNERELELQENLKAEAEKKPYFPPSAPLDPRYYSPDGKPIPLTPQKATVKPIKQPTVKKAPEIKAETKPMERPAPTPAGASVATPAPEPEPLATPAE